MNTELYIGLMSGTSMDGIDAALVEIDSHACKTVKTFSLSWPESLLVQLREILGDPDQAILSPGGKLDRELGLLFANAVRSLLDDSGISPETVRAIGSHGQTVLHAPDDPSPVSIQLGNPDTIAAETGIPVIADFRNPDIQLGGQGAPLMPAFHHWAFGSQEENRAVVNIGGIANVTLLFCNGETIGFDTGPGNTLLDHWITAHKKLRYDDRGAWAAGGKISNSLLEMLASDAYFSRPPPKSTGLEYFNLRWLHHYLDKIAEPPSEQDVQTTLSELTALQIANALRTMPKLEKVAVCGGGAENNDLMSRLAGLLPDQRIQTTAGWGIDPHWVEAAGFAWLARQRVHNLASNMPSVTGASAGVSLGEIFLPADRQI